MTKRYPAQIMVIVLVLMAILSVIALSVTLTSVQDKTEKTQNNQYQEYYAVGENKLLDFQQFIGRDVINSLTSNPTLTGDTGTQPAGSCTGVTLVGTDIERTCTFDNIDSSNFNSLKAESLKSIITITDSSKITNFPAEKDKDILIDIQSATPPLSLKLSWSGTGIAWDFSVDKTDYTTEKAIYSPDSIVFSNIVNSYSGTCFNYSSAISGGDTTVTLNITCPTMMYFRLRPIMKVGTSVNINLEVVGNTIPLQRTLTSTTTTSGTNTGSGNADNPTVVLETKYLLVAQPLSLFDYVLRTESDVIKN